MKTSRSRVAVRRLRQPRAAVASAVRVAVAAAALAWAGITAAQACGYHDGASASLGMLNWAYPDALHVRTAVWMAQRDGVLARSQPPAAVDPEAPTFRFEQMLRYRAVQARLESLRGGIERALQDAPMPALAIVLIGPMLWTRLEVVDGGLSMVPHATGPTTGDVVLVTDEPVVTALVDGRLGARDLREWGLVRLYGSEQAVAQVSALLDRLASVQQDPTLHTLR